MLMAATLQNAFADSWAEFSRAGALSRTSETVEIATQHPAGSRPLEYAMRYTTKNLRSGEKTQFAESASCPAVANVVYSMKYIKAPDLAPYGAPGVSNIITVDGVAYSLSAPSSDSMGRMTISSNVGSPLAKWIDDSRKTLAPCWHDAPSEEPTASPSAAETNPAATRTPAALLAAPSAAEMARLYPAGALRRRATGRAVIRCRVSTEGLLSHCEVISATAPEFGAASLQVSQLMRASPAMRDGRPVEGMLTLPVVWTLAGATPASASSRRNDCPNANTTQAEDECLSQVLGEAQAELARYRTAAETRAKASVDFASKYPGSVQPDTSAAFHKAEATWSAYKDAECTATSDNWSGGTIRTAKELSCEIKLTRLHAYTLWDQWLTFPDSTPPLLPEPSLPFGR